MHCFAFSDKHDVIFHQILITLPPFLLDKINIYVLQNECKEEK